MADKQLIRIDDDEEDNHPPKPTMILDSAWQTMMVVNNKKNSQANQMLMTQQLPSRIGSFKKNFVSRLKTKKRKKESSR